MASVSVSHLIIFIAAMLVAASVAGLLTTTVEDISDAIEEQGFSTSDDIRSDITIINDPAAGVYDEENGGELTLYVKNTGSTELPTNSDNIDLFINGIFTPIDEDNGDSIEVLPEDEESTVWGRNDVVRITIVDANDYVGDGQNRVKLVVSGAEDIFIWEQEE